MKHFRLSTFFPVLLILAVAVLAAVTNIKSDTYLSGWDNMHPEFNLANYAHQVVFGAWVEHEGTGGPAAQVHAANIFRLPLLWALSVLPDNLERYAFIFLMYGIGGVGMYLYLLGHWLPQTSRYSRWLAAVGGVYYLLNPLTLQQFYIIFEMFAVQFAFFPFLLLVIHRLAEKVSAKNLLLFAGVQLLLAPSAYQPLVFYLGMVFSVLYAASTSIGKQGGRTWWKLPSLVLGLTLLLQSYWIVPNLYFTVAHTDYVAESKANSIFKYESLWSVRSAGDWLSLISGTHYLFEWKDFDFELGSHEYIFDEWRTYFVQEWPDFLILMLGIGVLVGMAVMLFSRELGTKRYSVIGWYVLMVILVWIDLFPTRKLVEWLYGFELFFEVFRNSFTKFNVLLSLFWTLFFVQALGAMVAVASALNATVVWKRMIKAGSLFGVLAVLIGVMGPIFGGNLLNEKLRITYPQNYFDLMAYLNTKDPALRVLELPYFSFEGFEYYDWTTLRPGNGYQGLGFYFFGSPQAFVSPDFARWTESTDTMYFELRQALDDRDPAHLRRILMKYRIDLVILDKLKVDSYAAGKPSDYPFSALLARAGMQKDWERDNLTVYRFTHPVGESVTGDLYVPERVVPADARLSRVFEDVVYEPETFYVNGSGSLFYPFAPLLSEQIQPAAVSDDGIRFETSVPAGSYRLGFATLTEIELPIQVSFADGVVSLRFPQVEVQVGDTHYAWPRPRDVQLAFDSVAKVKLLINGQGLELEAGESRDVVVDMNASELVIEHINELGNVTLVHSEQIDWTAWKTGQTVTVEEGDVITLRVASTWRKADLTRPTLNCSSPKRGTTDVLNDERGVTYLTTDYGVNCASDVMEETTTSSSYLLHFAGENILGRSIKVFVNDGGSYSLTKQHLLPPGAFDEVYTLPRSQIRTTTPWLFNWETRSFKTPATNRLHTFSVMPIPLFALGSITLTPTTYSGEWNNSATILSHWSPDVAFHSLTVDCTQHCLIALDQAYDDLWWAIDLTTWQRLPHHLINGWANAWTVQAKSDIVILYVPELVSLGLLGGVIMVVGVLMMLSIRRGLNTRKPTHEV